MKKILSRWWWLFTLVFLLVAGGLVWFLKGDVLAGWWQNRHQGQVELANGQTPLPTPEPTPPPDPKRPVNILLLGYGGAGHDGGSLTDSMILAQVVPHEEKIYLINIPRDLWLEIPQKGTAAKANYAFAAGNDNRSSKEGGAYAKAALEPVFGEEIEYYVAVDFAGFKETFNVLTDKKGLEVDIPYSFTDEFYPIPGKEDDPCDYSEEEIASMSAELTGYELEKMFPCRYETISYKKGKATLPADDLLKFARSRHSNVGGGDFGRSQRQQAVIAATKDKLFSLGALTKAPALYDQYQKMVETDLDLELVTRAIANWGNITDFEMQNIVMSNQNVLRDARSRDGQYILLPKAGEDDYSQVQEFITVEKSGQNWQEYVAGQVEGETGAEQ